MELDAAVEVAVPCGQSFYPAVEARFKLCSRRYSHLYSAYGIERLADACHDDLAAQSIEQTLMELSPKLRRNLRMHVHADDDLGTLELVEGMLDAIGDVGCNSNLGLRHHIGGCGKLTAMFQQLACPAPGCIACPCHHIPR